VEASRKLITPGVSRQQEEWQLLIGDRREVIFLFKMTMSEISGLSTQTPT
jgi:hypothetical protein